MTWNVTTLTKSGHLENVKKEMNCLNIILSICETRWSNNGSFVNDEHMMIYERGEVNERGVGQVLDQLGRNVFRDTVNYY